MQKSIYLLRHGQTEFNRLGIVQGSGVDTSLNETGKAQAQAFFEQYQDVPFEVVFTSALKRTRETVRPFINKGIQWEQFPEINEMSWGIHEGKHRTQEMKDTYAAVTAQWEAGDFDAKLASGESPNEVAARCKIFVDQLLQRPEETVLICGHGRLNRCLLCVLLGLDLTHMEDFGHKNTGLYQLQYDKQTMRLLRSNDLSHFEAEAIQTLETDRF